MVCPEVALGGYFNSMGKPTEPAKLDFWKEGEGRSGKSILSSQAAVTGIIPFTGPWVRALLIWVTGNQQSMRSPSLHHPLDTRVWSLVSSSSQSLGETADTCRQG